MRALWLVLAACGGSDPPAVGGSGLPKGYAGRAMTDDAGRRIDVGYTRPVTLPGAQPRGWFITIEGPDGSGKTTQAAALATDLASRGLAVHVTREPGGTWLGERLRDVLLARTTSAAATDPLTDALLFNAARRQLVTEVIRPALAAGSRSSGCTPSKRPPRMASSRTSRSSSTSPSRTGWRARRPVT